MFVVFFFPSDVKAEFLGSVFFYYYLLGFVDEYKVQI